MKLTVEQVLAWIRQCKDGERGIILDELLNNSYLLLLASEKSLAKEWLSKEEDEAWKNL